MTKEQREEWDKKLLKIGSSVDKDCFIFELNQLEDFIESEVEKAKEEKEMEIANYFSIESAIGEKKLRRGVEYVVIKMSEYERLIKGLRI